MMFSTPMPMAAALAAAVVLLHGALAAPGGGGAADLEEELRLLHEDGGGGSGWREARSEIAMILRGQQHQRPGRRGPRGRAAAHHRRGPRRGRTPTRRERLSSLDFRHSSAHTSRLAGFAAAAEEPLFDAPASAAETELADGGGGAEAQEPDEAPEVKQAPVEAQALEPDELSPAPEVKQAQPVDAVTGEPYDPGSGTAAADDAWTSPETLEGGAAPAKVDTVADVFGEMHPAVDRQLQQQVGSISALRGQQEEAEHMRQRLGHVQREAQAHMDDALEMQRAIEGLKADHQRQSRRIAEIGAAKVKLEEGHRALVARVQQIMEPRLAAAQTRLENRKTGLEKSIELAQQRNIEREKERVSLLEALSREKEAKLALHKAEELAQEAERERSDAAEQLRGTKRVMGARETALRYARSRYEASLTEQRTNEDGVTKATSSLTRLQDVLSLEQRKLEEALVQSQVGLQGQLKEAEAAREKSKKRLEEEEKRYAEWQLAQKKRMEEAAADKAQYDSQQRAYLDKRSEILRDAEERAGAPYGGKTSRDDWAWPGAGGGAAVGQEVHLTEPLPETFTQPEAS